MPRNALEGLTEGKVLTKSAVPVVPASCRWARAEVASVRILSSVRLTILSVGGEADERRLGEMSPECVGDTLTRVPRPRPRLVFGFVSGDPRKSAMSRPSFWSSVRLLSSVRSSLQWLLLSSVRSSIRCLLLSVFGPVFSPTSSPVFGPMSSPLSSFCCLRSLLLVSMVSRSKVFFGPMSLLPVRVREVVQVNSEKPMPETPKSIKNETSVPMLRGRV